MLEELSQHIYKSEVIYEHPWRVGDLVVRDNLRLQHARTDFHRRHRRHLRRTQIEPLMVR